MKKLILVVHGIGEQKPGETIDLLVGGLDNNGSLTVENATRHLRERKINSGDDGRKHHLFPTHIRRVRKDDNEIVFGEVFWADLSHGRIGRIWTLIELFKVILGLGHLVRENAANCFPDGHISRHLANFIVHLIHGPIAAINLLLFAAFLATYLTGSFVFDSLVVASDLGIGLVGLLSIVGGLTAGGWIFDGRFKYEGSDLYQIFFAWMVILGSFFVGLVAYTFFQFQEIPVWMANLKGFPMQCDQDGQCRVFWYVVLISLVMGLIWVAIYILSLIMLATFWANRHNKAKIVNTAIFPAVIGGMVIFWVTIVISIWVGLRSVANELFEVIKLDKVEINALTGVLSPAWFAVVSLIIAVSLVYFKRQLNGRRVDSRNYWSALTPRIILNQHLSKLFVLFLVALATYAVLNLFSAIQFAENTQNHAGAFIGFVDLLYPIAVIAGVLAFTLYSFTYHSIAIGLGVLKDVTGYFTGSLEDKKTGRYNYPLRERIHNRFKIVLETLIASENPDEIVIVSHSQGTVIAVESLRESTVVELCKGSNKRPVLLVTMGAPVTHIYTEYFARDFPAPDNFRSIIDTWINIFRVDDFVGTTIKTDDDKFPENLAVPIGGHTGYWTDDAVRSHLVKRALTDF